MFRLLPTFLKTFTVLRYFSSHCKQQVVRFKDQLDHLSNWAKHMRNSNEFFFTEQTCKVLKLNVVAALRHSFTAEINYVIHIHPQNIALIWGFGGFLKDHLSCSHRIHLRWKKLKPHIRIFGWTTVSIQLFLRFYPLSTLPISTSKSIARIPYPEGLFALSRKVMHHCTIIWRPDGLFFPQLSFMSVSIPIYWDLIIYENCLPYEVSQSLEVQNSGMSPHPGMSALLSCVSVSCLLSSNT